MTTHIINDSNFDEEIKNSPLPILVDFWAEWCGPCKQIGPILEEIGEEKKDKINNPKIIGFPPPDFPPGINLFILFCIFLISSSIFGGSLLDPEPFPLPPEGPDDPQGD